MKRYLILTIVTAIVLLLVFPVFGQIESRERIRPLERSGNTGILSPEEMLKLREKWPTMSPEEREKFRKQMRERMDSMRTPLRPMTRGNHQRAEGDSRAGGKRESQADDRAAR